MTPRVESSKAPDLDLCSGRVFLTLLLASFGLALIIALSRQDPFLAFWVTFGRISLFVVWITVVVAAVLCAIRQRLGDSSERRMLWLVFMVTQLVVAAAAGTVVLIDSSLPAFELLRPQKASTFLLQSMLIGLITSFAILRYLALRRRWQQQVRAEAGARLEALQARIRPHFLFNTLNTIASLVRTRPDDAEQAVLDLADLLRSGLRTNAEHTLAEELELVRGYLRIESQRLGKRLRIDWHVDADLPLGQSIPALLVQPLVENAVVHGISKLPDGGCLKISARAASDKRWCIRVENPWPGPEASAQAEGNRMALDNIRQRLELAYGERASLKMDAMADRFSAEIRVPITGPGE